MLQAWGFETWETLSSRLTYIYKNTGDGRKIAGVWVFNAFNFRDFRHLKIDLISIKSMRDIFLQCC